MQTQQQKAESSASPQTAALRRTVIRGCSQATLISPDVANAVCQKRLRLTLALHPLLAEKAGVQHTCLLAIRSVRSSH